MKSIFRSNQRSRRHRQTQPAEHQQEQQHQPFFAKAGQADVQAKPFFQAKMSPIEGGGRGVKVGKTGDPYEREADAVADAVVNQQHGGKVTPGGGAVQRMPITPVTSGSLQRAATPDEEKMPGTNDARMAEDKEIQEKPEEGRGSRVEGGGLVQKMEAPKEEEKSVQKAEEEEEPMQAKEEEEEPVQAQAEEEEVQAQAEEEELQTQAEEEEPMQAKEEEEEPVQAAAEEEEMQAKEEEEPVQAKSQTNAQPASANLGSRLSQRRGSGSPLPKSVKSDMEQSFGTDFSGVRIHTDSEAVEMNRDLHAQAFTNGQDVYFNSGKFNPEQTEGKRLLAHELTHVVQQGGGEQRISRHMQNSYPWDGTIVNTWSAALRGSPSHANFITNIPGGTKVSVLKNSGNWLFVKVLVDGEEKSGYVSQELVGLADAHKTESKQVKSHENAAANLDSKFAELKARMMEIVKFSYETTKKSQNLPVPLSGNLHMSLAYAFLRHNPGVTLKSMNKDVIGIDISKSPWWNETVGTDYVGTGEYEEGQPKEPYWEIKKEKPVSRAMDMSRSHLKDFFITGPQTVWFTEAGVKAYPDLYRTFLSVYDHVPSSELSQIMDSWYKRAANAVGDYVTSFDSEYQKEPPFLVKFIADLNPLTSIAKIIKWIDEGKTLYTGKEMTAFDKFDAVFGLLGGIDTIFGKFVFETFGVSKEIQEGVKLITKKPVYGYPSYKIAEEVAKGIAKDEVAQEIFKKILEKALTKSLEGYVGKEIEKH